MAITTFPIPTVPPTANLIINTPSGPVTAVDVQSAINQLAGLIPAVGPGTDPLALVNGLSIICNNPSFGGNINDRYNVLIQHYSDMTNVNPGFSNSQCIEMLMSPCNGQNTYNTSPPFTIAKESFFTQSNSGYYRASGQKFLYNDRVDAFGMGDSAVGQYFVTYAGGPVAGDEGQGFRLACGLHQQGHLTLASISSVPTPTTINTTTTQAITASLTAQTVTVASSTGVAVGDWVVVEQALPNGGQLNTEVVQVTAFSPTSITGVFRCNHLIGVTVTPALRLFLSDTTTIGQDRVLINLTKPAYTTGSIASVNGSGQLVGAATAWTTNMVSGNATNIGAISLTADDYSQSPFNGAGSQGTLKSWYQIRALNSTTLLTVNATSVAGDSGYIGAPIGAGAYTVRQCVRILRIVANASGSPTGEVICEQSSSTWTAGDNVECVICPYADVTGFQYNIAHYTRGGASSRGFITMFNSGPRKFGHWLNLQPLGATSVAGGDGVDYGTIFLLNLPHNITLSSSEAQVAAISLHSADDGAPNTDLSGLISWGNPSTTSRSIVPNATNHGLTIKTCLAGSAGGELVFAQRSQGVNPDPLCELLQWPGYIYMPFASAAPGYILIDNATGVNFERFFARWILNDHFQIGTEKGAAGSGRDLAVKTNGVENLRFVAGNNPIKFSASANFSANGAVATVLGSLGPAGSHTTVQKWLTVRDDTGALGYVPVF
jgi:hypothetical protein